MRGTAGDAFDRPTYAAFLAWFADRYPGVPLFFIEFSAALDAREAFHNRAAVIYSALHDLSRTHAFLHLLSLPPEQIEKAAGDDFAYHFSHETVQRFAALWQEQFVQAAAGGKSWVSLKFLPTAAAGSS